MKNNILFCMIVSKISDMNNISQEYKDNAIGHLSFLKAWAYFNLVRNYGPVPIFRVSISDGASMHQPRASVPTVYEHIIELLQEGEKMYSKNDEGFVEGYASSGAAKALLAKVYATMASGAMSGVGIVVKGGDPHLDEPQAIRHIAQTVDGYESFDPETYYTLARDKAWEVIEEYDLFETYMDAWAISNRNKGENIWMVQARSGDADFGNTICQDYVGVFREDGSLMGNWYGMRDHWYKLFEEDDLRVVDGVIHRYPADGVDVTAAQNPDKPEQRMHIRLVLPAGSSLRAVEDPVFRTAEGLDQSVDAPGCVRQKKIRMQRQHLFFSRIATKSE